MTDDFDSCSPMPGYFTDIDTDIVYCCRDGCGSLPRDELEDSKGYRARTRLYRELIPVVREALDQFTHDRAVLQAIFTDHQRRQAKGEALIANLQQLYVHIQTAEQERTFDLQVLLLAMQRRGETVERLMNALWLGRGLSGEQIQPPQNKSTYVSD